MSMTKEQIRTAINEGVTLPHEHCAVIFTSLRTEVDRGYDHMAERMMTSNL